VLDTPAASLAGYGYLVAAALHAALLCRLVFGRDGRAAGTSGRRATVVGLAYAGALAATAAWAAFELAARYWAHSGLAGLAAAFDLLRYALWFAFMLLLLRVAGGSRLHRASMALAVLAAVVVAAGCTVLLAGVGSLRLLGPVQTVAPYVGLALAVTGLMLLEQLFRNAAEDSRWQLKPLCLGLACVFAFDFYLASEAVMFAHREPDGWSVRGGVHAVAVPLLLLASSRGSGWVSDFRISRVAAFRSTALLLMGVYLLFIAGVGYYVRYFGGDWGAALQIVFSFAALVVLVVLVSSGTMQAKLRVFLGKHFFSYRYDYREEWLKFTALLSSRTAPQEMGGLVIRGLADMVESPGAALWSRGPGECEFVRTAQWNPPAPSAERVPASAFTDYLREHGGVVDLEAYRAHREDEGDGLPEPPAWLAASDNAWLVVPLIVGDELSGFVVLARARTVVDVDWEVTELLATASRQAASFLAQMRATESLLETRKFDAFNRMSAFVVHDLKNIVTQLSLMLKNAKRLHANPEFQRDMLETVESSLDKMRQLMLQLREGEAPAGVQSGVDLVAIARRIEAVAGERGRRLEIDAADRLMTRGHEDRVERVIGHVVQNALDATDASGRVWLTLRRISGQASVEVGDTGRGMSPEFVRTRLFKPFNTTKSTGMGIGAYESFQYVRELGGSISVDSQPDKGTVMTILMPLFESRQVSDLQLQGETT